MRTHQVILPLLLLAVVSCGENDNSNDLLEQVYDGPIDIKADLVSGSYVKVEGAIAYGQQIDSAFDFAKRHGYTFSGRQGAVVDIWLNGDVEQGTDTVVLLYGPIERESWGSRPIASDDNGAGDRSSHLAGFVLPATGEYLIVATLRNRWYGGKTYSLKLECNGPACGTSAQDKGMIGLEIDFVGAQRLLPGVKAMLVSYFGTIGYNLIVEEDQPIPLAETESSIKAGENSEVILGYYNTRYRHRGQPRWHYLMIGDYLTDGGRGWGMTKGDVAIISAEGVDAFPEEHRVAAQTSIILHELGHNLGLTHEGFEPEASAGLHSSETCASAGFPAHPVPAVKFSPACVEHIVPDPEKRLKSK